MQFYSNFKSNKINLLPNGLVYDFIDGKIGLETFKLTNNKVNVVDLSQNCLTDNDKLALDKVLQISSPLLILSPDPKKNFEQIKYYPYFYYYGVKHWHKKNLNEQKTFMLSCLNANPHVHRWYIYRNLIKSNYDNCILSFHKSKNYDLDYSGCGKELNYLYHNEINSFSERTGNDLSISHDAYTKTYINLVTETSIEDNLFVSEKTWKPIASGQFFIIAGPKGIIAYLRKLGVDVYDDIIDHSYDDVDNWQERMDKVLMSIDKLVKQNIPELFNQTYHRRQTNVDNFFSGKFGNSSLEEINFYIEGKIKQLENLDLNIDSI